MEVIESFQGSNKVQNLEGFAVSQTVPDVSESSEVNNDINSDKTNKAQPKPKNATAANPSGFESSKNSRPKNKHEPITKEDMEYIKTHSAVEIAKHFNRSTTWAYSRMNGTKTTY